MYIDKTQQDEMVELINKFLYETNSGEFTSQKSNFIMNKLFENYMDKIIMGIIFTPKYSFWKYAETDDLLQEGRMAIYLSIIKSQFNPDRGSPFNFFSTVVSKNLMNFTTKHNRHYNKKSSTDISKLYNNDSMTYHQDLDKGIVLNDIIGMLYEFFDQKPKYQDLTVLLAQYININSSKKFIKKHFIQFAKGHNYSPAIVSTFFNYLKHFGTKNDIQELLNIIEFESHY